MAVGLDGVGPFRGNSDNIREELRRGGIFFRLALLTGKRTVVTSTVHVMALHVAVGGVRNVVGLHGVVLAG